MSSTKLQIVEENLNSILDRNNSWSNFIYISVKHNFFFLQTGGST